MEQGTSDLDVDFFPLPPPTVPKDATAPVDLLTDAQEDMHRTLKEYFQNAEYKLPDVENAELLDEEKFWLTSECMFRYLRATKWSSAQAAIQRLEETLRWRREIGLYDMTPDDVKSEAMTGKEFIFGFDIQRRPAIYITPSLHDQDTLQQAQLCIWMLEHTLVLAGPGVESLALMVNCQGRSKTPPFSLATKLLSIFQAHYPERLGVIVVVNLPFLLNTFVKFFMPFVDPVTRTKLRFDVQPVEEGIFSPDQLIQNESWGGSRDFQWDFDKYWPRLLQMCSDIRGKQMKEWRKLGARPGISEWDIKIASTLEPVVVFSTPVPEVDAVGSADTPAPTEDTPA